MKYFSLASLLVVWVLYLSQTEIITMKLFDSLFGNKKAIQELKKPIIYKSISKISDINDTLIFSCKRKWFTTYRNYEVGIEFKDKIIPTKWYKENFSSEDEHYIKAKLMIKNNHQKSIYTKVIEARDNYGWKDYYQFMVLDRFNVDNCKNIKLEIDFIESSIRNEYKNNMYLYIKVDERL